MAKGGRPKKEDGDQETRQVRVFGDIADMLADLALVHPKTTAQLLDQLIRVEVAELHAKYRPLIDKAKAEEAARAEGLQKVRAEAARLASEPSSPPRKKPKP